MVPKAQYCLHGARCRQLNGWRRSRSTSGPQRQVAVQGVLLGPAKLAGARVRLQQAVNRLRLEAGALSESRLAARPVGAHSATRTCLAITIFRIEFTRVVLPTPGPPVITSALLASASRTASRWLSASCRPVRRSTQGIALAASMGGQDG